MTRLTPAIPTRRLPRAPPLPQDLIAAVCLMLPVAAVRAQPTRTARIIAQTVVEPQYPAFTRQARYLRRLPQTIATVSRQPPTCAPRSAQLSHSMGAEFPNFAVRGAVYTYKD